MTCSNRYEKVPREDEGGRRQLLVRRRFAQCFLGPDQDAATK